MFLYFRGIYFEYWIIPEKAFHLSKILVNYRLYILFQEYNFSIPQIPLLNTIIFQAKRM